MPHFLSWIDLLWLPLAFFTVRKDQRLWVLGFFLSCMAMMRLEIEFITSMGYKTGVLHLSAFTPEARALGVYTVVYAIYLALALFSPYAKGVILMGSSLSLFFGAMIVSLFLMVL